MKTSVPFLGKLINDTLTGTLRIPQSDQQHAWEPEQNARLLNSIVREEPIGLIVLAETREPIPTRTRIGPVVLEQERPQQRVVVDGRRRLAAIIGTMFLKGDQEPEADGIDWRLYVNTKNKRLETAKTADGGHESHWFPAGEMLDTARFMDAAANLTKRTLHIPTAEARIAAAQEISGRIIHCQIPVTTLEDVSDATLDRIRHNLNGLRT